jgi:hypothetical protein
MFIGVMRSRNMRGAGRDTCEKFLVIKTERYRPVGVGGRMILKLVLRM